MTTWKKVIIGTYNVPYSLARCDFAPMDIGDIVLHKPTGETWTIAYVHNEHLAWCGWPEGLAHTSDCTLVKHATAEERLELLKQMAAGSEPDSRRTYAIARLQQAEFVLPKEY